MRLEAASDFLHVFAARLRSGYVFEFLAIVCFTLLVLWTVRTLSIPHVITGIIKFDTTKFYTDVEGQVARRKSEWKQRYLLSLDGGGAGGLSQIFILCEIANQIKIDLGLDELPRLCDIFDMIGGVGTGGWLAILIGRLGLTVFQAKEEYVKALKLRQTRDLRQLEEFLKQVVLKYTGNSETLMFERDSPTAHCHTFVGATATGDVAYLVKFRSYEVREGPMFNCPIWQAAYASLAYPNASAPVKIGDGIIEQICISGGIGWNNPTQEVIKEFESKWSQQKLACLASIGPGHKNPVRIDTKDIAGTLNLTIERVATDRERIAQDIAYRFQGQNMYFRLNAEQELQHDDKLMTLGDIENHTRNYLCSSSVTKSVDKLIDTLLRTTDPPEWSTTTENFEQTLDDYILDCQKWVDKIQSTAVTAAAEEVIRILEAIRTASWEEEEWLTLAKTIHGHCTSHSLDQSDENLAAPLRNAMNDYFGELKKIRMRLRSLLRTNPHRVWGLPTHEAFISRSITELDNCDRRIQACLVSDTHKKISRISQRDEDEEVRLFLKWLSSLEPHLRHNSVRLNRSPGTGRQFLESADFQAWCDHNNQGSRVVFASGRPGAGKTITCSSVIECLRERFEEQMKIITILLYCDFADRNSQTGLALIGALTKQLIWWAGSIPTAVLDLFKQRSKEQKSLDEEDAKTIFSLVLGQFDAVYICIDAFDECEPKARIQLLRFLIAVDSTSMRLFLTGRHSVEAEVISTLSNLSPKTISITAAEEDLRIFLSQSLKNDQYPEAMNESLKKQVVEKLVKVSDGLFLPAKLQIQSILEYDTLRDRRVALHNTPADLYDAYATTLNRIKQQSGMKPQRALNVLKWVYLGYRPLSLVELQHALATKPGDTTFNTEGIPSEELLVECCLGLVVVEAETLTVRLTHYTLREFFDKHWKDSDLFPFGHSTIAATCLSYLQFDHDVPPPSHEEWSYGYFERLKKPPSPLLQYSIENVGRHLKTNRDRAVAEQCIAVLEQGEKFQLLELATHDSNNTSLHWAAYWGCISVVELLIGSDGVNAESPTQQVPPPYAASQMAETVVTRPGVNINARSEDGHTPLSLAVWRGHDEVVRLLLGTPGVDLSVIDKGGDTPLSFASWRGQEDVIRLLVDTAGIDVDASEENDFTPPISLPTAALEGYEELIRVLVDAPGVDINAHDVDGNNPFLKAALRGHEEVIRLLLGVPGVDVNMKNKHGNTPLSVAAWYGLEAVIRLLLGVPGIDVNECDKDGDSPLCSAAYKGYEGIVQLLLSTPGIDINLPNKKGETPLSSAAANGHGALVQLLLAAPGINAN